MNAKQKHDKVKSGSPRKATKKNDRTQRANGATKSQTVFRDDTKRRREIQLTAKDVKRLRKLQKQIITLNARHNRARMSGGRLKWSRAIPSPPR